MRLPAVALLLFLAAAPCWAQTLTGPARVVDGNTLDVSGQRIHHVPGSHSYARTKIDESKGERRFCGEDEARAAGWSAPR